MRRDRGRHGESFRRETADAHLNGSSRGKWNLRGKRRKGTGVRIEGNERRGFRAAAAAQAIDRKAPGDPSW